MHYRTGSLTYISPFDIPGESTNYATDDDLNKVKIGYKLHGNTTYELKVGYGNLTDVFGRRLRPPTNVKFQTGHLKPRLILEPSRLVLRSNSNATVPISVANLSGLDVRLATKSDPTQDWFVQDEFQEIDLSDDQIVPTTIDFENWLPTDAWQFVASIQPIADPKHGESPETSCIYGQITPYDVQARIGHSSSIAWITDLETGLAVANASVSLVETKDDADSCVDGNIHQQEGYCDTARKAVVVV